MSRIGQNPLFVFLLLFLASSVTRLGPIGDTFFHWEYDSTAVFSASSHRSSESFLDQSAVIYLDEESHQILGESYDAAWDRSIHAKLLNKLTKAGAKLVYFDILFQKPSPKPEEDQAFEDAIRENGSVVLLGQLLSSNRAFGSRESILPPLSRFRDAAAGWGLASFQGDSDGAIRLLPINLPDDFARRHSLPPHCYPSKKNPSSLSAASCAITTTVPFSRKIHGATTKCSASISP